MVVALSGMRYHIYIARLGLVLAEVVALEVQLAVLQSRSIAPTASEVAVAVLMYCMRIDLAKNGAIDMPSCRKK